MHLVLMRGVTFGGGNDGDLITYNTTQTLSDATTFGNLLANNTTMGVHQMGYMVSCLVVRQIQILNMLQYKLQAIQQILVIYL